jgi:hypothetical protein
MSTVPERPPGANAPPSRWTALGLADPRPNGGIPYEAMPHDLLAYALVLPGAEDPVEGIVDAVCVELRALADTLITRQVADELVMLSRRLNVAMLLLRRADNGAPMPLEDDEEPLPGAPTDPPDDPEDVEVTRDAAPDKCEGKSVCHPALDVTVTSLPTNRGKGDAKP